MEIESSITGKITNRLGWTSKAIIRLSVSMGFSGSHMTDMQYSTLAEMP